MRSGKYGGKRRSPPAWRSGFAGDQDLAAGFAGAGVIATFGASAAVAALGPAELAFVGAFMEEDMSLKLIGNTLHILRQKYAAHNIMWLFKYYITKGIFIYILLRQRPVKNPQPPG